MSGGGKAEERDGRRDDDERRPDRDRGSDGDRETRQQEERDRPDDRSSGGGGGKPEDGDRSGGSAAQQELESNVEELLEESEGERPDKDSGLQLPSGSAGQGDEPGDPLEQACQQLGDC